MCANDAITHATEQRDAGIIILRNKRRSNLIPLETIQDL